MKNIKKTNAVVIMNQAEQEQGQKQYMGQPRSNPNAMQVDREKSCYVYGKFGHMAQYCRNREGMRFGRRIEYEQTDNLKEEENLETLA